MSSFGPQIGRGFDLVNGIIGAPNWQRFWYQAMVIFEQNIWVRLGDLFAKVMADLPSIGKVFVSNLVFVGFGNCEDDFVSRDLRLDNVTFQNYNFTNAKPMKI